MPRVSSDHRASRRAQILDAAAACFARSGFRETTMRDICEEAELSPGAVYGYFDGKEEIIAAVAEGGRASTRELFRGVMVEHEGLDALEAVLRYVIEQMETTEGLSSTRLSVRLWGEALDAGPVAEVVDEGYETAEELFADTVRDAQARFEIDASASASDLARLIVAVYQGLSVQKVHDPDRELHSILSLFLEMLRTDAPEGE